MIKILANDGIHDSGKQMLEEAGFRVDTNKIEQDQLAERLKGYDAILVRSATKITKDIIDACPGLKLIGRAGVGLDNIDVDYAKSKGIEVVNTPAASSPSVAELVFAHLFGGVRFLHQANREMPDNGSEKFKELKKKYSKGMELRGKTIGIVGFGRIGQEVAKIALGLGMKVMSYDMYPKETEIEIDIEGLEEPVRVTIHPSEKEDLLEGADFVSINTPFQKGDEPIIGQAEFDKMKEHAFLINCSRGGAVDEEALLNSLESGKIVYAGIDVFAEEPTNNRALLKHPNVSLTPHIGAATGEAQSRIGTEIAEKLINFFKGN